MTNSLSDKTLKIKHIFYFIIFLFIVTVTVILSRLNFKPSDIIIAFSTLVSPIVALQIQTYLEKIKTKDEEKMKIFKTLMATRANQLSVQHVEALNMINVGFYEDANVLNAWKEFLNIRSRADQISNSEYENSFVNLMQQMAISLKLNFYDEEIRKSCYRPKIHDDFATIQITNMCNISKALNDGKLHVVIDNPIQGNHQTIDETIN